MGDMTEFYTHAWCRAPQIPLLGPGKRIASKFAVLIELPFSCAK